METLADPTDWFRRSVDETAESLQVDLHRGLDESEVARRRAIHGANELVETPRRAAWKRFLDQFNDLLVFILLGAAVVSAAVGDLKDPIVIGVVLVINAIMGFVQENRADNALAELKGMLETIVSVRRGGSVLDVPASELVPGDVVLLEAGDRIPADGRFTVAATVSIDESMLTGESVTVEKQTQPVGADSDVDVPLGDRVDVGYMNTTVVRGRAELVVTETGARTEVGRLAVLLESAEVPDTPLQEQIHALGKRLAGIAVVAVVAVFVVALFQADQIDRESISQALLTSVALAVAAIPEGLPAVVTVTLAVGVSRLARRSAIVKRLPSVETLGSTTVICSDKTGTLTLNQMTATDVLVDGQRYEVTGLGYGTEGAISLDGQPVDAATLERLRPMLRAAALCNDAHLRELDGATELVGDPTEGALIVLAAKGGIDPEQLRTDRPRLDEVPFDSATKIMGTLHEQDDDPARSLLVVKGAPDVVLARCALGDDERAELLESNEGLGADGLRVLALATRVLDAPAASFGSELADELEHLELLALVGILDPPRAEAVAAIEECGTAGIGVKMITGDHASTAGAIAGELGIVGRVVTGAELDRLEDDELADQIEGIGVCARVSPEHKVRVVKALQSNGEVVAMTGDGVNDAASLKQAEIGVAMGITGTEVTKEAGDMILADDNFASIVKAVEGGRSIYDNIVTFVRFQLTTNISAILTILIAQIAGFGVLFNAIQILFVNIIADGPPAIALGVDPPKPGIMERSPRPREASILSSPRLVKIIGSALVITAGTLGLFMAFDGDDRPAALTMAFTTFVFFQLVNSFCVRSGTLSVFNRYSLTNRPLLIALVSVVAIQVAVVQLGFFQQIFDTVPLGLEQWAWVAAVPLSLLVVEEIRKAVVRAAQRRSIHIGVLSDTDRR